MMVQRPRSLCSSSLLTWAGIAATLGGLLLLLCIMPTRRPGLQCLLPHCKVGSSRLLPHTNSTPRQFRSLVGSAPKGLQEGAETPAPSPMLEESVAGAPQAEQRLYMLSAKQQARLEEEQLQELLGGPHIKFSSEPSLVVNFTGVADPTVVFFRGFFIAAFSNMYGMDAEVGFALSQDGVEWERAELIIEGMKWASLFVYRDQLYLMGTQHILWEYPKQTNDLQLALLSPPPDLDLLAAVNLTQGMGVHILNNVPLVEKDRVFFPFMLCPPASRLPPIQVTGFQSAAGEAWLLGEGRDALRIDPRPPSSHTPSPAPAPAPALTPAPSRLASSMEGEGSSTAGGKERKSAASGRHGNSPVGMGAGRRLQASAGQPSAPSVHIGPQDWDRVVFGVRVGAHTLGPATFVRLEERQVVGGGRLGRLVVYARVVGGGRDLLWLVPQRWAAGCWGQAADWSCKETKGRYGEGGTVTLTSRAHLFPDTPLYQEFFLSFVEAWNATSLVDPRAWRRGRWVGSPVNLHPQAHALWTGDFVQERDAEGRLRTCTSTGGKECIYWQEPVAFASSTPGGTMVAVRITTDQNCNSAILCHVPPTLPAASPPTNVTHLLGQLACPRMAPIPGFGNVRGFVFYDPPSRLYWAVSNFNTNTTSGASGKSFLRQGQRCVNERGNVGLFYSADMHNWLLARVLAAASSNGMHLMYVSCVAGVPGEADHVVSKGREDVGPGAATRTGSIPRRGAQLGRGRRGPREVAPTVEGVGGGSDIVCVGRSNGELVQGLLVSDTANNHDSKAVVAWRVRDFRGLVH